MVDTLNNITPVTIWFTGLSACGKSTLSQKLYDDLTSMGMENVILLDGEAVRERIKNNSFDNNNREKIGVIKAEIALKENQKGNIVLISGIASKRKWRQDIRSMIDRYFEIYLKCSAVTCAERDYKGHYNRAIAGEYENFAGITEDYEEHEYVDLQLDTGTNDIEYCSNVILNKVKQYLLIND
ncbi:MAG: adenylyl-sulfate kinase [Proteobacteria bacterium]|nr:adenylyl-sulfate kinase [Pseudomonadota bacterium]NOG59075.1 adenylyl-sulfate kinase [Pseudomonadota bacterium]